jgi:hypothetical protein
MAEKLERIDVPTERDDAVSDPDDVAVVEVDDLGRPIAISRAQSRKAAIHWSRDPRIWRRLS